MPVTEVAGPNELEDWLKGTGHLSANLLKEELVQFKNLRGYLPRVIAIHMPPLYEDEIRGEMAQVAKELGADVSLGYADMKVILQCGVASLEPSDPPAYVAGLLFSSLDVSHHC